MNERLAVGALALLTLIGLWIAPWGALNREVGASSSLLLLPNRIIDFTGRTDPVTAAGQKAVLFVSMVSLLVIAGASALKGRLRYGLWLLAGLVLIITTTLGLGALERAVDEARLANVLATVERTVENPRGNVDVAALETVLAAADERSFDETLEAARAAGARLRRLPFESSGLALAAFLCYVTGGLALIFALRLSQRVSHLLDRLIAMIAVPMTSILLALLASAVVILILQSTAVGDEVQMTGWQMALTGRLDTLWYAFQTLFADSLGTLSGFMEALKFATPLIFTGLAVAFGFQAGLFNIGAPGQMVLGAIFAMLVGVYLPGPRIIVLPLAILASALGGGLWGGLAGWLKARYGANEVINTILLNYIAASLMLFLLSSAHTFAASAIRIFVALTAVVLLVVVLNLIPSVRALFRRSPRFSLAVGAVLVLGVLVWAGQPQPGDSPYVLELPFKAPGSEPKSYPLLQTARLPQVPALMGIDLKQNPGVNVVTVNYAVPLALLIGLLFYIFAPRISERLRRWPRRLIATLIAALASFGVAALLGWTAVPTTIPPTNLNLSFVISILMAVGMYYLLWRTKWGYELRAVGLAPKAAEYGGANIAANTTMVMFISGALAGLTATHYVLGGALQEYALRQSIPTSDGFDGIAVALLGANTPVGVVLSAFLFGILKHGGSILNITFSDLTRDVVNMILALVVLFIAAKGFLPDRFTNPLRRPAAPKTLDPEHKERLDPPAEPTRSSLHRSED